MAVSFCSIFSQETKNGSASLFSHTEQCQMEKKYQNRGRGRRRSSHRGGSRERGKGSTEDGVSEEKCLQGP